MTINAGTSVREISERLEKEGVVRDARFFRIYITLMGYSSKLRAGDYLFESGLAPRQVASKLLRGDFKTYKITIPEGWTVKEIATYLKGLKFVEGDDFSERFLSLSGDKGFIDALNIGWNIKSLEGYLYPSTYEVYKLTDPKKLAFLMTSEFRRKFSEKIEMGGKKLGFKPAEIVVMASIIEKETSKPDEKPVVASVFYNRLKKGMILQSDPTVIYGLKDFDGNLRKQDLANTHKYNTYMHKGLPPGPICNPGEESIMAAMHPAETDYLFFVSKNDGSHIFSKNLEEHNKAVWKYQKGGKK